MRIWKSTDDQSRATPMATALRPRIAIAGHQRIGGRVEESFIASALPTQAPGRRAPNQTGSDYSVEGFIGFAGFPERGVETNLRDRRILLEGDLVVSAP